MELIKAFTHCPRCGNIFTKVQTHLNCESCGLHYYLNPKPCTAIVLQNEAGQYLFVERAVDPNKGWWDLPGGFVELDETFEEGIRRETQEELGIELNELNYIGSFHDKYDYQDVIYSTLANVYTGKIPSDTHIQPADDVASYKFFELSEIPLDKIAFPSILLTIELLKTLDEHAREDAIR